MVTRYNAVHLLHHILNKNYKSIQNILMNFAQDENEKPIIRSKALSLSKKMKIFETMFLIII